MTKRLELIAMPPDYDGPIVEDNDPRRVFREYETVRTAHHEHYVRVSAWLDADLQLAVFSVSQVPNGNGVELDAHYVAAPQGGDYSAAAVQRAAIELFDATVAALRESTEPSHA